MVPTDPVSRASETIVLEAMRDYPLKPGEALFLGPASVAYLSGDYERAPWLFPHVKAPGGRKLPDQWVTEGRDWSKLIVTNNGVTRNKATKIDK